jgi:hypothetical protein
MCVDLDSNGVLVTAVDISRKYTLLAEMANLLAENGTALHMKRHLF